jgi:outer membrane protein OmpA-like peptidoglycan-associated protein
MSTTTRRATLAVLAAASFAYPLAGFAQDETTIKGMILGRDANRLLLRTGTGDVPVRIMDTTKVESSAGVLGVRRQARYPTELIAGLPIEATGMMQGREFVASAITFNPGDLKTAQQIQAGQHGTEQRLASVGELVPVGRTSVYFPVGSSTLSAKGKQDLQAIAAEAKTHPGARLAVVGRADPTGSVEANQRLSEARAAAVTSYLLHSAGVLPGSLLPATAAGESPIFQDPNPPRNNDEARRVTVTIAVSKATMPASF